MDAKHITQCVSNYYQRKLWLTASEVGLCKHGRLRADLIASNMGSYIVIVEVKSSVADFRTDKKWHKYAQFCNKFLFAMSVEVYDKVKTSIPKGVGVFLVYPSGHVKIKNRAKHAEIDPAIRLNIMTRLAYRSCDTLYDRKSKTAGADLVAKTAVEAIQAIPKEQRKGNKALVISEVKKAIQKYV
jgi:hypothetical protein